VNVLQDDADCLCGDFDVVPLARPRRGRQSVFSQTLDVKGEGFPDFRLDLRDGGDTVTRPSAPNTADEVVSNNAAARRGSGFIGSSFC
jgi:hypothetical protein